MPTFGLTIEVTPGRRVVRRAVELARGELGDMRPFWRDFVFPRLETALRKRFETRGRHGGAAWRDPSPRWRRHKDRRHAENPVAFPGTSRTPLIYTGRLMRSLTQPGAAHQVRVAERRWAEFGTTLPYASATPPGLEGRGWQIIRLARADQRAITEDLRLWVLGVLRRGIPGAEGALERIAGSEGVLARG